MDVKKDCSYAIAAITSMGVRITPTNGMSIIESNNYSMQATSAETNVLNVASSLGYKCLAMTKFVKGSPIAKFIQGELRKRNIDYVGDEVEQGGPWGYRHQFNIVDAGYGLRGPYVTNDRAGEVGRSIRADDFDLKKIFEDDGVAILHISGLIAALSEESTQACLEIVEYAKKCGTLISFDVNYRESFWKGREEELKQSFHTLASLSDILIGADILIENDKDPARSVTSKGLQLDGEDSAGNIESLKSLISAVKKKYPKMTVYAHTLRQVIDAQEHLWGAVLHEDNAYFIEEPRPVRVLDRIGGGDGFVGGLLYSIIRGYEPQEQLKFAWASGVLATTSVHDYGTPLDEEQIWNIYNGNANVKR